MRKVVWVIEIFGKSFEFLFLPTTSIEMASTSKLTASDKDKEMDSLIQNLEKDAQLVTKAVEKLADE